MTHSKTQSPELRSYEELISSRAEEIRRELETASVAEPKKSSPKIMRGLIIPIAIILVWLGITQYRFFNPQAGTSVFVLSEVETIGSSDLCPGDSLRFRVNVGVTEDGVYRLAMSTWRVGPPATIVFSEGLDMVIADSREFPIEIEYVIPATYKSPVNGKPTEWSPGMFSRDIAVTATGRNTSTSTRKVPFVIRDNCEEE